MDRVPGWRYIFSAGRPRTWSCCGRNGPTAEGPRSAPRPPSYQTGSAWRRPRPVDQASVHVRQLKLAEKIHMQQDGKVSLTITFYSTFDVQRPVWSARFITRSHTQLLQTKIAPPPSIFRRFLTFLDRYLLRAYHHFRKHQQKELGSVVQRKSWIEWQLPGGLLAVIIVIDRSETLITTLFTTAKVHTTLCMNSKNLATNNFFLEMFYEHSFFLFTSFKISKIESNNYFFEML